MIDFDVTNPEEALYNLQNQLKNAEQATARQALSEIIGIDLDKVEKLINGGQIVFSPEIFSDEEMTDTIEENEQTEQEETVTLKSVLAPDMFGAEDPNGIYSVYWANEFNIGSVIAILGVEFFKAVVPHEDHTHDRWIDVSGRMYSNEDMAEMARRININNNGEGNPDTKIIHFG